MARPGWQSSPRLVSMPTATTESLVLSLALADSPYLKKHRVNYLCGTYEGGNTVISAVHLATIDMFRFTYEWSVCVSATDQQWISPKYLLSKVVARRKGLNPLSLQRNIFGYKRMYRTEVRLICNDIGPLLRHLGASSKGMTVPLLVSTAWATRSGTHYTPENSLLYQYWKACFTQRGQLTDIQHILRLPRAHQVKSRWSYIEPMLHFNHC